MDELEIDISGIERSELKRETITKACEVALVVVGIESGHLAVSFVAADEIQTLNRRFRNKNTPTDVLSFPIDEAAKAVGPRELGDVIICPEHTSDQLEAVVHGVLHLSGMDHESDQGQMLKLQDEILRGLN